MKFTKTSILVATTAVALTAFAGGSTAMATTTALCKVHQDPCAPANRVTEIHMETTEPPVLLTNAVNVECESSLIKGTVLALGSPQVIHLTKWTWEGCQWNNNECEFETLIPSLLDVLKLALNLGEVTSLGNSIYVECQAVIKCEYSGAIGPFHIVGAGGAAGMGMISVNQLNIQPNGAGLLCPTTAKLDALFESLEAFYVVS